MSLHWHIEGILDGLEAGLRKAAEMAPEGVASISVDGWSVDYARLAPDGQLLCEPFCYRDERTVPAKEAADAILPPRELFERTGVLPHRINTIYQLLADPKDRIDEHAPWVMLPEYVLYWLSGRRVAEYTNASHTGLVDFKTGDWDQGLFSLLKIPFDAAPPIVSAGTVVGRMQGPQAALDAFGPDRLMFGSDWPVCEVAASYTEVKEALVDALGELSPSDHAAIFGGNAVRFYRLTI